MTTLVAGELDVSDDEAQRRIDRVCALLPGLRKRGLGTTGARVVARWAADVDGLATSLLRLQRSSRRVMWRRWWCERRDYSLTTITTFSREISTRFVNCFRRRAETASPTSTAWCRRCPNFWTSSSRAPPSRRSKTPCHWTPSQTPRAPCTPDLSSRSRSNPRTFGRATRRLDQTHVARGRARDLTERPREAYYDEESTRARTDDRATRSSRTGDPARRIERRLDDTDRP